jgi:hypothetical protein
MDAAKMKLLGWQAGRKTGCQYGGTDSFKGSFQEGAFFS